MTFHHRSQGQLSSERESFKNDVGTKRLPYGKNVHLLLCTEFNSELTKI